MEHISTEDLERFRLGRMSDPQAIVSIEHHIFECRECADRIREAPVSLRSDRTYELNGDQRPGRKRSRNLGRSSTPRTAFDVQT